MSPHEFCDHCPGCRPALFDPATGEPLAADSQPMLAVNRIWNHDTSYAQRKAFIKVSVHNSRTREDLQLANEVIAKFQKALEAIAA